MTAAFVEHHQGRAAYEAKLATLRREIDKLRAEGKDRPLHWEKWTDAVNALGPLPYRKGALFLDRLRRELGETAFWRGLAIYTRRHAGKLADSRGLQQPMEEAAGRPLTALFEEGVYR
ncbi:MAG: M1 family metallopeptidase [Acidobacteria bacterium]|nr:M1 family metallopeptidase [Acidobacteriota bacterium]